MTGRVATDFPTPITAVRVVHQGAIVSTTPVAADGSFRLSLPASKNLAIQLVSSSKAKLVMPRHVGGNTTLFAVRAGGAAFDLGTIHFVGDVSKTTVAFHDGAASTTECEDGHDASGAVCADDSDSSGGTCDASSDTSETEGSGTDDVNDGLADDGDAVPEHNFPADGCSDDGGADGSDGSGSDGSGSGA